MTYLQGVFDHELWTDDALLGLLHLLNHLLQLLVLGLRAVARHPVFAVVLSEILNCHK